MVDVTISQGQLWWAKDEVIVFPESRDREPHESRGCIVIEGNPSLGHGAKRVLVVPTSTRTDLKDVYDVVIPSPPAPGGRDVVALVSHVQPILREDLKHLVGPLKGEWVDRILAAALAVLDVEVAADEGADEEEAGEAEAVA